MLDNLCGAASLLLRQKILQNIEVCKDKILQNIEIFIDIMRLSLFINHDLFILIWLIKDTIVIYTTIFNLFIFSIFALF